LTPSEDFLFGVRMKGDSIRFGPAGGELLWAGIFLPLALVVSVGSLWAGRGGLTTVLAVWIAVGGTGYLIAAARSRVLASPDGVTVRGALRSQHYPWSQISDITVVDGTPTPPFRLSIGEHGGGGIRPDVDSCKAYLVLVDRSLIRLAGFESAIRTSGLSGGTASPTEIKVGALDRYRRAFAPRGTISS
jgi:Bacterial PH domain